MTKHVLSGDTTIYQYQLTSRVPLRRISLLFYYSLLLIGTLLLCLFVSPKSALTVCCSLVIVQGLHMILLKIWLLTKKERLIEKWSFLTVSVWFGLAPKQHYSYRMLKSSQVHLLWAGLAVIGACYPWLPLYTFASLVLVHIWLTLPRQLLLWLLRGQKQAGFVKVIPDSISNYIQ